MSHACISSTVPPSVLRHVQGPRSARLRVREWKTVGAGVRVQVAPHRAPPPTPKPERISASHQA